MLHCNMNTLLAQLVLDDLLADLRHARKADDLGRLAFVVYCEVRRWARNAGETALADRASDLVVSSPFASRGIFLEQVDSLIQGLEQLRATSADPQVGPQRQAPTPPDARGAHPA
jgi:hypothetical protein